MRSLRAANRSFGLKAVVGHATIEQGGLFVGEVVDAARGTRCLRECSRGAICWMTWPEARWAFQPEELRFLRRRTRRGGHSNVLGDGVRKLFLVRGGREVDDSPSRQQVQKF